MSHAIDAISKIEGEIATSIGDASRASEFLEVVFSLASLKFKFFTHTYFCKKAGFGSRNAVREIISGRKSITHASYRKITAVLGLSPRLMSFFALLVHRDFPELKILQLTPAQTEQAITRQRRIIAGKKNESAATSQAAPALFADRSFLLVYAAISATGPGTSLEEISTRTRLKPPSIARVVQVLERNQLIEKIGDRFVTSSEHLFFERLGGDDYFNSAYQETIAELAKNAGKLMAEKDNLLMQSVFNIDSKHLPNLIKTLKEAIGKYVDENACDSGDRVVKLAVAFYR